MLGRAVARGSSPGDCCPGSAHRSTLGTLRLLVPAAVEQALLAELPDGYMVALDPSSTPGAPPLASYALTSGGYASKYRPASSSIDGGNGSGSSPAATKSAPNYSAA